MSGVVMFVLNDVTHDARVLREAGSLTAAGHQVTIVGRPGHGHHGGAERELRDGLDIRRVPVPGRIRGLLLGAGGGRTTSAQADGAGLRPLVRVWRAALRVPVIGRLLDGFDWLVRWRFGTLAWCSAAAAAAPVADIWFGHDLSAISAALEARRRHGGRIVFDMHELYLDAGDTATRPGWARAIVARSERAAIRAVDAVMTVNAALAAAIREAATPKRLVIVHNAALRRPAQDTPASPLRGALGLGADVPIAIYTGALAPGRGIETIVAASREASVAGVHVAFLGDGILRPWLEAAAAGPDGGRLHVLPAVAPLDVTDWVAGADVAVLPIAPTTRNHRLSTPNKLFEAIAAGVPVVASDFAAMREVVLGDPAGPLGAVCDPIRPRAVAQAIATIVTAPVAERDALRARVREAASERWSWEREGAKVVELVEDLGPAAARAATTTAAEVTAATPTQQRLVIVVPSSGQFDSRTRRIALGCAERGHSVTVVARREAGLPNVEELGPRARLIRVDAGITSSPDATARSGLGRLIAEAQRILGVARRTSAQARTALALGDPTLEDAEIVHAMGFLALPVARALARNAGAKLVYDARDIYARSTNLSRLPGIVRGLFVLQERRWARAAARVVTVNESIADELVRSLGIARPLVVMNCQPAQPPQKRRPTRLRRALGLPAGTPIVLYHGGFMPNRGLPELVNAFGDERLKDAHLVLMGYGDPDRRLRAAMDASPSRERIHILAAVPPSELLDWVGAADVGVMPNQPQTLNERLSTPNKLFECLAAGTPVVSSDFPERRRIIVDDPDGPLGAVCDPTDPSAIAAAIATIVTLPKREAADLRARCARAARARYSWEPQFDRLLGAYGALTGRPW